MLIDLKELLNKILRRLTHSSISVRTLDIRIQADASSAGQTSIASGTVNVPSVSGFSARCICGWSAFNESGILDDQNCSVGNIYRLYVGQNNQEVGYAVKNTASSYAKFTLRVFILYTRNG